MCYVIVNIWVMVRKLLYYDIRFSMLLSTSRALNYTTWNARIVYGAYYNRHKGDIVYYFAA